MNKCSFKYLEYSDSVPGREPDHSPPCSTEVNAWSCTSTPQYVFMVWCLIKQEICFHGVVLNNQEIRFMA